MLDLISKIEVGRLSRLPPAIQQHVKYQNIAIIGRGKWHRRQRHEKGQWVERVEWKEDTWERAVRCQAGKERGHMGGGTWLQGPPTGALSPASKTQSYISDGLYCASCGEKEGMSWYRPSHSHPILTPHPLFYRLCPYLLWTNTTGPTRAAGGPRSLSLVIHLQNVLGEVMTTLNAFTFSFHSHVMKWEGGKSQ